MYRRHHAYHFKHVVPNKRRQVLTECNLLFSRENVKTLFLPKLSLCNVVVQAAPTSIDLRKENSRSTFLQDAFNGRLIGYHFIAVIIFWTTLVRSSFPRHSFYFNLTILSETSLDDSVNLLIDERSPSPSTEAHTDFTSTSLWSLFFYLPLL